MVNGRNKEKNIMGFDISGINPNLNKINKEGEPIGGYFRNNVWWWRKLWSLVGAVGEDRYRAMNDIGDVCEDCIDKEHLEVLDKWHNAWEAGCMNDGHKYEGIIYDMTIEALNFALENKEHESVTQTLKLMDENYGEEYPFDWDNVKQFRDFVVNSGGFEIW